MGGRGGREAGDDASGANITCAAARKVVEGESRQGPALYANTVSEDNPDCLHNRPQYTKLPPNIIQICARKEGGKH